MNRRDLFKGASAVAFGALISKAAVATAKAAALSSPASSTPRDVLSLNHGWRFYDGDIAMPVVIGHGPTYTAAKAGNALGAAAPAFDDSEWPEVSLPHDFASFQPIVQDANPSQGYRKRGIAWYRNRLRFEVADEGHHIELQLEGIATNATIWFNGTLVARNWSGYNSAYVDLTPYVTYGDSLNWLVIRVDANAMEGWWYEGGGIYRDAWIVKRKPVHIMTDGVFAHPVKDDSGWRIPVEVALNNIAPDTRSIEVTTELLDTDGGVIASGKAGTSVAALENAVITFTLDVPGEPHLWSPDTPKLYRVRTRALSGAEVIDEVTTPCGFRTQRFDANKGFFLNDNPLKIKGVCLHQDHAGVGVAIPRSLWAWRLKRLKEMGVNAIRCAHNAPASYFLDLCDEMGFLVMDENRVFNPSPIHMTELEWLIRRDRNHPSIFLWSVFNEEPMQGTKAGYEMVRRMVAAVRDLDTARAVTAAMNDGLFTPVNVSQAVDVVGFNYQQAQYDDFHKAHPNLPMISSEDTCGFMTRGEYVSDKEKHIFAGYDEERADWGATHRTAWKDIATRDFIAGSFVWTGFDYHGEPSPYTWPSNSSFFGILDLCGFPKTAFWIHQAQWVENEPVLGLVPHWNWDTPGQPIRIMACSNQDEVELFVNGKSAGKQLVDKYDMNFWTVPYAPGSIEVRGYEGGKLVKSVRNVTSGEAVALRLTPDRSVMDGDGRDTQPITVEALDKQGRHVPLAQHMITYEIEGGNIIGLGNGNPNSLEPEKGDKRSLFNGLGQVIVQTKAGSQGIFRLRATAIGLKASEVLVNIKRADIEPRQASAAPVQLVDNWFMAPASVTPPDPAMKASDSDMNSWQWFRPGTLLRSLDKEAYSLVAARFTPFARAQKQGGKLVFSSITGVCDVYADGHKLGAKGDPAEAPLSVILPPAAGERRISVIFHPASGQPYGFDSIIRVEEV